MATATGEQPFDDSRLPSREQSHLDYIRERVGPSIFDLIQNGGLESDEDAETQGQLILQATHDVYVARNSSKLPLLRSGEIFRPVIETPAPYADLYPASLQQTDLPEGYTFSHTERGSRRRGSSAVCEAYFGDEQIARWAGTVQKDEVVEVTEAYVDPGAVEVPLHRLLGGKLAWSRHGTLMVDLGYSERAEDAAAQREALEVQGYTLQWTDPEGNIVPGPEVY